MQKSSSRSRPRRQSQGTPSLRWRVCVRLACVILYGTVHVGIGVMMRQTAQNIQNHNHQHHHTQEASVSTTSPRHPETREERFPSVQERVKLYMSSWYLPPCRDQERWIVRYERQNTNDANVGVMDSTNNTNTGGTDSLGPLRITTMAQEDVKVTSNIRPDREFLIDSNVVRECAGSILWYYLDRWTKGRYYVANSVNSRVQMLRSMRRYCRDVVQVLELTEEKNETATPILAIFGDDAAHYNIPVLAKWRWGASREQIRNVTEGDSCWNSSASPVTRYGIKDNMPLPPILWKLATKRHWEAVDQARRADTEWPRKIPKAIWRGSFTGPDHPETSPDYTPDTSLFNITNNPGEDTVLSKQERQCLWSERCRFVYRHASSKLVDAGFTKLLRFKNSTVRGVPVKRSLLSIAKMQRYKIIVSLEGNDVSSGLKWNLASQSVVLMPPPTKTTWAMEELLEPWVHYIPMKRDGSDAKEMARWVLANDDEAQRIAERATLFMHDMLYHPDAARDHRAIKVEILRRYRTHWTGPE